jgi:LacI family transcriptional regulator
MVADSQAALFRVIKIFRQLAIRIPDDISLMVYDDIPELEIFEVSLTTVGPSIIKLAVMALDILSGEAKPEEGTRWIKEVVEAELIVRESTRVVPS